jgi:hypothetical protein
MAFLLSQKWQPFNVAIRKHQFGTTGVPMSPIGQTVPVTDF